MGFDFRNNKSGDTGNRDIMVNKAKIRSFPKQLSGGNHIIMKSLESLYVYNALYVEIFCIIAFQYLFHEYSSDCRTCIMCIIILFPTLAAL